MKHTIDKTNGMTRWKPGHRHTLSPEQTMELQIKVAAKLYGYTMLDNDCAYNDKGNLQTCCFQLTVAKADRRRKNGCRYTHIYGHTYEQLLDGVEELR